MTSDSNVSSSQCKGKGRAVNEDNENTPLLASSGSNNTSDQLNAPLTPTARPSLLLTVFLASLSICIAFFVFFALLTYSYSSEVAHISPEVVIRDALVVRGPEDVRVLSTSEGQLTMQVDGHVGLRADALLDVAVSDDGLFSGVWKAWARWGTAQMHEVSVHMGTIQVRSRNSIILATLNTSVITIPLTINSPKDLSDLSWLTSISLNVTLRPTENVTELIRFVREGWRSGALDIHALVPEVQVRGGVPGDTSWRRHLDFIRTDVETNIYVKIPDMPGLPHPGRNTPFPSIADLVKLESFQILTENSTAMIHVSAKLMNPLPGEFNISIPSLPFIVSLPSTTDDTSIAVTSVLSSPFRFTHPFAVIALTGHILPLPRSSSPILSHFLSIYLAHAPPGPPIQITTPLLPPTFPPIPAFFPLPKKKPRLLRDVTIKDVQIKAGKGGEDGVVRMSGVVYAKVVLPKGVDIGVHVHRIWPDVLVFDGVPVGTGDDLGTGKAEMDTELHLDDLSERYRQMKDPDPMPLPDPLPERAFARIRPEVWLPAISVPVVKDSSHHYGMGDGDDGDGDEDEDGAEYIVTAKVVDIPLEVLPGRDSQLRHFVTKVIFGTKGALAGVQGIAAVAVAVDGLPTEEDAESPDEPPDREHDHIWEDLGHSKGDGGHRQYSTGEGKEAEEGPEIGVFELTGLPFQGTFRVGKKTF
ncbi:hypothetical protein BD410DRAFT_789984 [Rickenella mellea]|uniref:Uncharacterized protein n=1 Tax=Rickenella mellea TaxID=50990 RepID=A0A4Y7Q0Q6_9AGAM|nr:hypothetical protein BD410DRAFT_789984 [Rickenella mellea]